MGLRFVSFVLDLHVFYNPLHINQSWLKIKKSNIDPFIETSWYIGPIQQVEV